jgi:hypothetical protein
VPVQINASFTAHSFDCFVICKFSGRQGEPFAFLANSPALFFVQALGKIRQIDNIFSGLAKLMACRTD